MSSSTSWCGIFPTMPLPRPAGWVPVSAGIVEGRRVTSYPNIADDLRNAGAEWEDAEVVVDGNLITSRKPDDLPAFCRAIVGALTKS